MKALRIAAFLAGWLLPVLGGYAAAQSRVTPEAVRRVEAGWLTLRDLHDRIGVVRNIGATVSPDGVPLDSLTARAERARESLQRLLDSTPRTGFPPADSAAIAAVRQAVFRLTRDQESPQAANSGPPDCDTPLPPALRSAPLDSLTDRTFACYGAAARRIIVDGDTLDRLSILGLLGRTPDPEKRRRLFLALGPVWQSVNGNDGDDSPYRRMVQLRVARWGGNTPMMQRARALGVEPDVLEDWLVSVLSAWRAALPDTVLEPWDNYFLTGESSRLLSARVPLDSLITITNRYYRALGADPDRLRVHYDITPRPGKYPVSFTDFGGRAPIEPWIFTSYRIGGLDNLGELLHEAGHAVHIAAIKTRGAYTDWPDSDTFTEAIADLAALEINEPAWQRKFLGASAPLDASLRAKYSGIVMDVAWALFEIRAHRDPERSPNAIWTDITSEYLRIRPHPELSWWAMRGQLVDGPGYMLNYAFGAILIADIRARLAAVHGSFTTGDSTWYPWVSNRLYRFGHSKSARAVVQEFLGRAVSVEPILRDLRRIGKSSAPPTVVTAARMLDVERGVIVANPVVVVQDGRISAVGRRGAVRIPSGATRIDLGNVTLLPGLIDTHVHLTLAGAPAANALATLKAGFTTVRDLGAVGEGNLRLRDSVNRGVIPGPRIISAGQWLGVKGGTCDFRGIGLSGADAMAARVREDVAHGADVIKVCLTAWVKDGYEHPEKVELTDAELVAITAEAGKLGKPVVAHAIGLGGVKAAVRAGLSGVVHSGYVDDETIRDLVRHKMYLVPTLACLRMQSDSTSFGALVSRMKAAWTAGVPMVFGTDAGVVAHGTNAVEFAEMLKIGMKPADAIRAATSHAAEVLGWQDRVGTLAPGKLADLIAVPGNPLRDIGVLTKVSFVMKGGEVVR